MGRTSAVTPALPENTEALTSMPSRISNTEKGLMASGSFGFPKKS